jgi:ribosomal protein S2
MKTLNKYYLLNKGILLGDKNYNYKIKSLLSRKLYSNYIYNYEQSFFFITKVIKLIIESSKNRNNILIYSSDNDNKLKKISSLNKNIVCITERWIPGSLSNFRQCKKYSKINIKTVPNLVILLSKSYSENLDILEEASNFSIPVITMFPNNLKFDNLYYPFIGNNVTNLSLNFYSVFFLNCILHGLFLEKINIKNASKT